MNEHMPATMRQGITICLSPGYLRGCGAHWNRSERNQEAAVTRSAGACEKRKRNVM